MAKKKNPKFKTWVLLGDTHGRNVDPKSFSCALKVIKDINPDGILHNGDVGDFESISHWTISKNKKLKIEGKRLKQDIKDATNILDKLSSAISKKCERVVIIGNHDDWVSQYVEANPQLEGFSLLKKNILIVGGKLNLLIAK